MSGVHKVRKKKVRHKFCPNCERNLPLTAKYWRRRSLSSDGFEYRCKNCATTEISSHYVKFLQGDVIVKGEQGVFCPLYAERCGVCTKGVSACWRINEDTPDEEYPVSLFTED